MNSKIRFFVLLVFLSSCKSEDSASPKENQEIAKLRNELRQAKLENEQKDALIDESLSLFSDIQNNVAQIQNKENEIRLITEGGKGPEQKEWLLQELKNIQFLREENARKIKSLNEKLAGKEQEMQQLTAMLQTLQEKILAQEVLIDELQNTLGHQDQEYSKLFDAYMEQSAIAQSAKKELAQAFYVYGSLEELKKNNVIVQTKGFIGIGKKSSIKDGFNEDYFTPIDRFKQKSIQIVAEKMQIMSDHPSSSYEIKDSGSTKTILISNPSEFWKISKYLVIIVE